MLTGTSGQDSETSVVSDQYYPSLNDNEPTYVSRHLDCPDCGYPMILYGGLLMCGCGHTESCCE